jgi:hypothetical protein
VLWQTAGTLPQAQLAVPDEARLLMTNRKTLSWRVTALDASGKTIAVSAAQRFRVMIAR